MITKDDIQHLAAVIKDAATTHLTGPEMWETIARHVLEHGNVITKRDHENVLETWRQVDANRSAEHARQLEQLKAGAAKAKPILARVWQQLFELAPPGGTRKTVPTDDVRRIWRSFDPRDLQETPEQETPEIDTIVLTESIHVAIVHRVPRTESIRQAWTDWAKRHDIDAADLHVPGVILVDGSSEEIVYTATIRDDNGNPVWGGNHWAHEFRLVQLKFTPEAFPEVTK